MSTQTIVIGGGIVGSATAYFLQKSGHRVTIVDRGRHGGACSHANCGFLSPSHVPPLARPGAVTNSLATMFRSDSPFYIRPRISPALWDWLIRFWWNCNPAQVSKGSAGRHALLQSSRRLYQQLIESENLDCNFETKGLMFVYLEDKHFEAFEKESKWLSEEYGVAATPRPRGQLQQFEPAIKDEVAGAWHFEDDAHLKADELMRALRERLEQMGVTIRENCEVESFVGEPGKLRAVQTTQGEIEADQFVVATGSWSPMLNGHLGCQLRIQPGKGYSITMDRPTICPHVPMILEEYRVAVTPFHHGYRLGSTMEFSGYDDSINEKRLALLARGASNYLKEPSTESVHERWFGWRPMTPDGMPYIDFSPKYPNAIIAAGHNMLGLSMGAATGKLVSEMLNGEQPHIDPLPYRLR